MIKINLVSVYIPKERLLVEKQFITLVGLLIGAIVLGLLFYISVSGQRGELKRKLVVEKTEIKRLAAVQNRINEFEKKKKRRQEILDTIKKLQARRIGPYPFLDDLNIMLPPDIWLTNITESNLTITVSGYTFSSPAVADMMRSMEASEHFSNVALTEIQQKVVQKETVKKFTVTAKWDIQKDEEKQNDDKKPQAAKGKKT
ncbi:MAG: PilN domain-containing protein [Nitrospinota bacterium]